MEHLQTDFYMGERTTQWGRSTPAHLHIHSLSFHSFRSEFIFSLRSCCVAGTNSGFPLMVFVVSTTYFRYSEESVLPTYSLNFPGIPVLVAANAPCLAVPRSGLTTPKLRRQQITSWFPPAGPRHDTSNHVWPLWPTTESHRPLRRVALGQKINCKCWRCMLKGDQGCCFPASPHSRWLSLEFCLLTKLVLQEGLAEGRAGGPVGIDRCKSCIPRGSCHARTDAGGCTVSFLR